ncbi:MAG: PAS domain S-box protein [Thermodesulfovibrionales bacterium]|nr:PAS domain S-box protein [Thermodesulfovibrionales bacterium]
MKKIDTSFPTIIKVLALAVLGFVFNLTHITLYGTIQFIFGGIFVVFSILRFGMFWGTVCAFLSSIATYLLWGHVFGVVYFTFEALFIGYLNERKRIHVVLGDAIFWLTLGLVFIFVTFRLILGLEMDLIISVYLKCFINGIFYSLLGSILENAVRAIEYSKGQRQKGLTVRYVFLEIILVFIMIPLVISLLRHSWSHTNDLEKDIKMNLEMKAFIVHLLQKEGLQYRIDEIDNIVNHSKVPTLPMKKVYVFVTSKDGTVLNKDKAEGEAWIKNLQQGNITEKGDDVFLWSPKGVPALKAFSMSAFFKEIKGIPESPNIVFLVTYTRDYLNTYSKNISNMMFNTLITMLILIVLAHITSRMFTKPIQQIVETGKTIPDRVISGDDVRFQSYFIYEFDYMAKAMQDALKKLIDNYKELSLHKQQLQHLVDERTQELRIASEQYKNITENINDIVYRLNLRPKITLDYVNPAVTDILGYTPEELKRDYKLVLSIVHPEDRRRFKESLFMTKNREITTLRWVANNGKVVYLEHKNTYNFDTNARLISIEGIARDITERRKLAELFRESAKRFRVLFEQSPNAILIIELQRGIIMDVNSQAEKLLQDRKVSIIGRHFTSILSDNFKNIAAQDIKSFFISDKDRIVIDIIRADKKVVPVEVVSNVIEIDGKQALCSVFRDISERRRYEQFMKNALHEKEMLIREIHHRVKNNLQVILSLINIQSNTADDEKTKNILQDLDSRIKAMAIVHETLYQSEDLAQIDLCQYTNKLINSLNDAYGRSDLRIRASCDNITIPFEMAIRIGLMLNEMVSNAFKHAFKDVYNGLIEVRAFMVDSTRFRIVVSDNGVGIKDDFESKKGSLGFQLLNLLVKQMSGEMMIKSENGTEISITIGLR